MITLFSFLLQPLNGAFGSYYQVMLRNLGYSQSLVGVIIALGSISTIILPFVAGSLAEKGGNEKLFMIAFGFLAALSSLPSAFNSPVWLVAISFFMMMGSLWVLLSLYDGFVNKSIGGDNERYGFIRGMGTVGYVIFMLFYAVSGFPDGTDNRQIILNQFITVALVCIALSLCKSPERTQSVKAERKEKSFSFSWFDREFWIVILIIAFQKAAMSIFDRLIPSYMTEVLGLGQYFTAFIAFGAMGEIFVLIFGARWVVKHDIQPVVCMMIGACAMILRLVLYCVSRNIWVFLMAQALHSLCFGAGHVGMNRYITKKVDKKHLSLAFTIYWTIGTNLPLLVSTMAGGFVIDNMGYLSLFSLYTLFPAVSIILSLIYRKRLEV